QPRHFMHYDDRRTGPRRIHLVRASPVRERGDVEPWHRIGHVMLPVIVGAARRTPAPYCARPTAARWRGNGAKGWPGRTRQVCAGLYHGALKGLIISVTKGEPAASGEAAGKSGEHTMPENSFVPLPGSERQPVTGA